MPCLENGGGFVPELVLDVLVEIFSMLGRWKAKRILLHSLIKYVATLNSSIVKGPRLTTGGINEELVEKF